MPEKQFLSKLNFTYAAKNRLHKAIVNLIELVNRTIIDEVNLKKFQDRVISELKKLNKLHAKCRPVEFKWGFNKITGDWYLSFGHSQICDFVLYHGTQDTFYV